MGARRAGRYGVLLALSSAALAFGPQDLLLAVLGHLLLCGRGLALGNRAARLAPYAYLRLAAWPVTLPLLLAAALRLAPGAGTGLAWLALVAGHALLWRGLRSGLHAPGTGERSNKCQTGFSFSRILITHRVLTLISVTMI